MTTALLAAFDQQATWCAQPAPFTARVLRRSRAWLAATPEAHAALSGLSDDPLAAAVALRWAAGLHLLALHGLQPWAGIWPPQGHSLQAEVAKTEAELDAQLDAAIGQAWQTQQPVLRDALSRAPQTNEVQRSAALLPGLLHVAQRTGLPLVLLEIGASAGLNLWCDRYHHAPSVPSGQTGQVTWSWGDPQAPLTLQPAWTGPPPWAPAAAPPPLQVLRRAACDAHPVDLRQPGEALRGASFIWPEQTDRMARLRNAQAAAARWMAADGVAVQPLPAALFADAALRNLQPGAATVLMHSVVWQYIQPQEQHAILHSLDAAGQRATAAAPLAWLRLEPPRADLTVELRCRLWPGGADTLLATAHPHGASVHWLAPQGAA